MAYHYGMTQASNFVHLHLHSQYSLLDGAVRLPDMIEQVKALNMPAVAVTDHGNMFGAIDFYKRATQAGIKPILGCEVYVAKESRHDRVQRDSSHLILLARNEEGYKNLKYLVSMAFTEGFYYRPRIDFELLGKHAEGLIGATACLGGGVAQAFRAGGVVRASEAASALSRLFEPGHFFLEVQNNGYTGQHEYNDALRQIGKELGLPLVATNDVHYLTAEDAKAHNVLMCIQKGVTLDDPKADKRYSNELFLRSAQEMQLALEPFPDAVENTLLIAEMCGDVNPTGPISLPDFALPEGVSLEDYLRNQAHKGLNRRFEELDRINTSVDQAAYRQRLDTELDVICQMGFAGYFLIVEDFIDYAKRQDIPVGPGRGSGAGSLVAYSLRITNLDPIPLHLLFERFLNPERVSMPDFDIDFCKDRREEVIAYVVQKYGEENVGQIATFHQLKSRSVVRDVGRVMGKTYGEVDRIAKLIPEGGKTSLAEIKESEPKLKEARAKDAWVDELIRYAERLENLTRHAGMHAAGVVIGNHPLWHYVPVFRGSDRDQVTKLVSQFDMKFVEQAGLVKFDFLGLKTLTVIDNVVKLINKRPDRTEPLNIDTLPIDSPEVFELISGGNTWGVFQLESRGFQELLRRLKPDCFEDIVAAVALYRPGPLEGGMVDQFVECKHGRQQIVYPHPNLESILKETYGVIVYQEQVMQAAQILSGYSLGAADIMRRAMGKKKPEEMAKQRAQFVAGAEQNGVDPKKANEIFELIDKFAGYGFNKSHSAAYALITYQTAWLKANYPVEFEAGLLTCDQEDAEKVARYIKAGQQADVQVLPPDINRSEREFSINYPKEDLKKAQIIFGLGAIKGVGAAALTAIFEARVDEAFVDIFDFAGRVDLGKVNKAVIESLIKAGAFDGLSAHAGLNRGQIFNVLDRAIERGRSAQKDRESGQISLFGALEPKSGTADDAPQLTGDLNFDGAEPWDELALLAHEKQAIGFYMSGHPMERFVAESARLANCNTVSAKEHRHGSKVTLAGMVMDYRERTTKTGKKLGLFNLEDLSGRIEVVVYAEALLAHGEVLKSNEPLIIKGTLRTDQRNEEETKSIILAEAEQIQHARTRQTREVYVHLDAGNFSKTDLSDLKMVMERHPGRCDAFLAIWIPGRSRVTVTLPEQYRVAPSDNLLGELNRFTGIKQIEFR